MGRPNKFRGIPFVYKIIILLDNINIIYAENQSESQWEMNWRLILEEFGPNIYHIAVVDNILADKLSRLTYMSLEKYDPITMKAQ